MKKRYVRHYLFAEPSIIGGLASILDIGATLKNYNYSEGESEADAKALANDWNAVGDDLRQAIEQYEKEYLIK